MGLSERQDIRSSTSCHMGSVWPRIDQVWLWWCGEGARRVGSLLGDGTRWQLDDVQEGVVGIMGVVNTLIMKGWRVEETCGRDSGNPGQIIWGR